MNPDGASTRINSALQGSLAWIVVVALAYVAAARLGLALDAVSGFAALVWPPSGIALAALLLGGYRLWPAVFLGAAITNYWAGAPVGTSLGIAAGNTIAALFGMYLIQMVPGFKSTLERIRDVLAMILAAILSTIIAATAGVTVLELSDLVATGEYGETWRAWWIGDAIGDLVIAPLILVWASWRPGETTAARFTEALGIGAVVTAVSMLIFDGTGFANGWFDGREYMLFPPLIWAALRFGVRGAVTTAALAMTIAITRTVLGHGPFAATDLSASLFSLQAFMGVAGATFLLLGAAISERARTAADLVAARETAESANRAKAGFLASVSHELRTPLNAITGYVELLSLELEGPLTEKQRNVLARISHSQRHLLLLIEDVLGFAQVEAGRLSVELQPVAVADVIASVEPIVAPELRKKGLTLDIADCDPGLLVRADPDKLRQVLLNLVTNAIKFTDAPGEIGISAHRSDDKVRVCVSDTGIGIPETEIQRVFTPFFQVDQGPTRRFAGLGLGLSIVREVVTAMKGDVDIESKVGKGTRVSIALPIETRPAVIRD